MNTKKSSTKSSTTVLDIFKEHRIFSILAIVLPSLFFAALLFFSFTTNGLRETTLRASTELTDGKVYLQTSSNPTNLDTYHGEIIGTLTHYQDPIINGGYRILSASSVEDFLVTNLSALSENQIPILAPMSQIPEGIIPDNFVVAGTYPTTSSESPSLPIFNPLHTLLNNLPYGEHYSYLVDDNTDKIINHLQSKLNYNLTTDAHSGSLIANLKDTFVSEHQVLSFTSHEDALAYAATDPSTSDLFSNTLAVSNYFASISKFLNLLLITFIIIFVLIFTFSLAHLIDRDTRTLPAAQAKSSSRFSAYLIYSLSLGLISLVLSTALALLAILITYLTSSDAVTQSLQAFYLLSALPSFSILNFNLTSLSILVVIFSTLPISFLLASARLTPRHISRTI